MKAVVVLCLLGFCFGSSLSQHHNHNEGFEGHNTRKVRRLQRLLLHNNRHTMQFREEEQGMFSPRPSTAITDDSFLDHFRDLRSTFEKPDQCPPRKTDTVRDGKNGKKRTCPRKCSTDSDCLNDRKLCLCDGACGMSCIRPEKECPELPDPPHGQVIFFKS